VSKYTVEFDTSTGPEDYDEGRCYEVIDTTNYPHRAVASRCTQQGAERIKACLDACHGVDHLHEYNLALGVQQNSVLTRELSTSRAETAIMKACYFDTKDKWNDALDGWIKLQVDIAALIPPIDGERANDPIINRVKRLAASQDVGVLTNTLVPICSAIIKGYAEEKSGLDDDMLPHLQDLADHAQTILDQAAHLQRQHDSLGACSDKINKLSGALKAVYARALGIYDQPDLVAFGLLLGVESDMREIAQQALEAAGEPLPR